MVSVGHGRVALMRLDEAGVVRHWLEVRPVGDSSVIGWRIEYADAELGASGRIDQVIVADRVHGRAEIGGRSASWRIRVEQTGIEAERWRVPRPSERDRAALTRAHELTVEVLGSDACSAELLAAELGLDAALGGQGSRASRLLGCE